MLLYSVLSEKDILKQNKDLIDLHKRCITEYLVQRSLKLKSRNKFFKIYHFYIDENNIRQYFFRPISLFVKALITDRLSEIQDYIPSKNNKKRHGKKKVKR